MIKTDSQRQSSKDLKVLRRLLQYAKPYKGKLAMGVLAVLMGTLSMLMLVQGIRHLVDAITADADGTMLLTQAFVMIFMLAFIVALASYLRVVFLVGVGDRMVTDLRRDVYNHLLGLSARFYEEKRIGELVSRLTTDAATLMQTLEVAVPIALRSGMQLVGGMALMLLTSTTLSMAAFLIVPLVLVGAVVFGRRVRSLARDLQARIADVGAQIEESMGAVRTVQAFTREPFEQVRFQLQTEKVLQTALERNRARGAFFAFVLFAIFNAIAAVLWIGGKDVIHGAISAGELAAFLIYAVMVATAAGGLMEVWTSLQQAAGATERLFELLNVNDRIIEPKTPQKLPQTANGRSLKVEKLSYRYGDEGRQILQNVNFDVNAGEMVAIVGPSGAGKSTLLQLLMRFDDPQQGSIAIDGVDVRKLALADVREHIAQVAQDPVIFNATAGENIHYGRLEATQDEVVTAAKQAQAHSFISLLPHGYNTNLGERGVKLSGGQRQRIAIARTLLRAPDVLLLDEATSHLDAESEQQFQQALETIRGGRTIVVVAHRLATVKAANRILVLDEGGIVAQGTHKELLQKSPLYKRLASLQFIDK